MPDPTGRRRVRAESAESGDTLDVVELGESKLRDSLTVDPAPVRDGPGGFGRFRLHLVIPIVASVVVIALLGSGVFRPRPQALPSASVVAIVPPSMADGSPSPSVESCPTNAGTDVIPTIVLAARNQFGHRTAATLTSAVVDELGFDPPIDNPVEVGAGYAMALILNDARCVDVIRLDIHGTALSGSSSLAVSISPTPDGRKYGFSAPPPGDWTVRVAIRLRAPSLASAPWAIYFVRMNVGYVAYASPLPSGASPVTTDGQLVAPVLPCGPVEVGASMPPSVDLVTSAGRRVPGALGDYTWAGSSHVVGDPSMAAVEPTDLGFGAPFTLEIAGAVCAVRWQIFAAPLPGVGQSLQPRWNFDDFTDNPNADPQIAAQNVFNYLAVASGDVVVRGLFEFPGGSSEVMVWRVRLPANGIPLPIISGAGTDATSPMVVGCGTSFELADGNAFGENCLWTWPDLRGGPAVRVKDGSMFHVAVPGFTIYAFSATYQMPNPDGVPWNTSDSSRALADGSNSLGVPGIDVPVPAAGVWDVQVFLTARDGSVGFSTPYFVRMTVAP
ncbi:MAG: hypothetical protein ABI573_11660 [Chloroflexota bacterium]